MNILITRIRRVIEGCSIAECDRDQFVAFALAQCLANSLSLPSTPVSSVSAHFNNTHGAAVNDVLSGFNDKMTIDIFFAKELVKKIYAFRYEMVFNASALDTLAMVTYMYSRDQTHLPPMLSATLGAVGNQEKMVLLNNLVEDFKQGWKEEIQRETIILG